MAITSIMHPAFFVLIVLIIGNVMIVAGLGIVGDAIFRMGVVAQIGVLLACISVLARSVFGSDFRFPVE